MTWTEDRIDRLREAWADGMTAQHIGDELGVGRHAVIGKAHRLGLKRRSNPVRTRAQLFELVVDRVVNDAFDRPCTVAEAALEVGLSATVAEKMWNDQILSQHGGPHVARAAA